MNELFDITSVQVYGQISGPKQVILLKLGIDGAEDESKTLILTEWGAQAISNSLAAAGISPTTGETPEPITAEVVDAPQEAPFAT